jgi:predicted kinase/ADP-ribose pyrophosphatase YjhB (NUDIX family)
MRRDATLLSDLIALPESGAGFDASAVLAQAQENLSLDVGSLRSCAQSPQHHGEGDVAAHTEMALWALIEDDSWWELGDQERSEIFVATLLHDVAKPACARLVDGQWRHLGHSHLGEKMARGMLWRAGVSREVREHVAQAIRFHQHPFFWDNREDARWHVLSMAEAVSPTLVGTLARADAAGRICEDPVRLAETVELFFEFAAEMGVARGPYEFANDSARFEYFLRGPGSGRDPAYAVHENPGCATVTMTSGLPGTGKTSWAARRGEEVISLDGIRRTLGVRAGDPQHEVVLAAREQARVLLRRGENFTWDATMLTREHRSNLATLAFAYGARVHITNFEVGAKTLYERNSQRAYEEQIPRDVLERMVARWEVPTRAECHLLSFVDG